jgi:MFS family permease
MSVAPEARPRRWYDGLTGYHWLVLVVASLGWLFDTMDQWLYVLARQPAITELLGPGATREDVARYSGIVQMIFIAGWATGGFLFGIIGDKLGRTRTMMITVLMYAGFTGLSALAQTWEQFAVLRFLVGLGIGGEFAAGAALVAETFPAHARPTALGIMQAILGDWQPAGGGDLPAGGREPESRLALGVRRRLFPCPTGVRDTAVCARA